ncbi:threonine synthase-like 2 isoform X4 [Myotis myotis]|uniref:threonine synthase-like 2 isoform X4 n=1 Tax=Myotis myotis TaxID=51298 RepID=UPI00174AA5CA|nr:threonine synthase-like 2 isoform X4 [Myotis myotis]
MHKATFTVRLGSAGLKSYPQEHRLHAVQPASAMRPCVCASQLRHAGNETGASGLSPLQASRVMWYVSTRGMAPRVDFEGALFSGYAPDGGLFMPEKLPQLNRETLRQWSALSYPSLVVELCALFIGPELIPRDDLNGTSGDTGSAAIESVRGAKNVSIIVLLPQGHCTKIQELQMTTVLAENVRVFGVEGNSDELDEPIKAVFADVAFVKKHNLMSLNSINWSRVLVQMAHHFFAYFQCMPSLDLHPLPAVEVVVPTGAAGNLAAGCIAQKMGLPIHLVAAVNCNDIIHRTVQRGDFSLSETVKPTLASAMDIQVPYNMERIFWLLSGSDSQMTRGLMEQFERTQSVSLPEELQSKLSAAVTSESVSDEAIMQTMARCWQENQSLLCPHTAVAVSYHYQQMLRQTPSPPRCCLAPASAAKFPEAVVAAGLSPETPMEILALEGKETRCTPMRKSDDWTVMLRDTIENMGRQWRATS